MELVVERAEIIALKLAAVIESIAGVQSQLVRDECDRVRCAHCDAAHHAGRRVETARHIDGEDGHAARIHPLDHPSEALFDCACKADAEQAVDDEARPGSFRPLVDDLAAARRESFPCGSGLGRPRRRSRHVEYDDAMERFREMRRCDPRVTAIVAGPCDDEDRRAGVARKLAGGCRNGSPRTAP